MYLLLFYMNHTPSQRVLLTVPVWRVNSGKCSDTAFHWSGDFT